MADKKPGDGESKAANRKARQPLTRHPLFPAIVAIWFGALFGLGSLAVRPSLLEDLVVASRLDLVFASAAPPLGMTARILLALVLTGIGGMLGAVIARRLGRMPNVPRERKRGAASVLGRQTPAGEVARKRPLTIAEQPQDEFTDFAPLPGGALHSTEIPSIEPQTSSEPENAVAQFTLSRKTNVFADGDRSPPPPLKIDELDLGQFGSEVERPAAAAEATPAPPRFNLGPVPGSFSAPGARPFASPAPVAEPPAVAPVSVDAEAFSARFAARSEAAPRLFDAPGLRPDGESVSEISDPFASECIANEPAAPEPVGIDALRNANLRQADPDAVPAPEAAAVDCAARSDGDPGATVVQQTAAADTASGIGPGIRDARPAAATASAAERIASAELAELSQVELLERLALAMKARRARSAPAAEPEPVAAPPAMPLGRIGAPTAEQPAAAIPPVAVARPVAATPVPNPVQPAIPAALRPLPIEDFDLEDVAPSLVPPRHINLSTSFGAPSKDRPFAPPLASILASPPPLPSASSTLASSRPADASGGLTADLPAEVIPDEEQDAADDESRALEDGYSSLLSLSRPAAAATRPQFVRIGEPEPDTNAIEPVVIFPSQTARFAEPQLAPAAPPHGSPAPASEARPFDAPGSPLIAPVAPHNSEDTERALRAALASLQRMSGAA